MTVDESGHQEEKKEYGWNHIELHFPDAQEVREHLFHLEYAYPMDWKAYIEYSEQKPKLGQMPIKVPQFYACLRTGLIRPVHVESSDDESFFFEKLWSPVDADWCLLSEMNELDVYWLRHSYELIGSLN